MHQFGDFLCLSGPDGGRALISPQHALDFQPGFFLLQVPFFHYVVGNPGHGVGLQVDIEHADGSLVGFDIDVLVSVVLALALVIMR